MGAMEAVGGRGSRLLVSLCSSPDFFPPLSSRVIWRRSTVVCGGCSGRPPPGGAPRRPPPRPWRSPRSRCCRPWATDGPRPAPPGHLAEDGDRQVRIRMGVEQLALAHSNFWRKKHANLRFFLSQTKAALGCDVEPLFLLSDEPGLDYFLKDKAELNDSKLLPLQSTMEGTDRTDDITKTSNVCQGSEPSRFIAVLNVS